MDHLQKAEDLLEVSDRNAGDWPPDVHVDYDLSAIGYALIALVEEMRALRKYIAHRDEWRGR